MPDITETDIERILVARAQGKLPGEIAFELNTPPAPPQPSAEELAAAQGRRDLQAARGALNAEGASPGQMPDVDPYEAAFAAACRAGARGSQQAFQAGVEKIFEAAQAGDPRVTVQGTVDAKTREAWIEQAHERQANNRERTGWTHR